MSDDAVPSCNGYLFVVVATSTQHWPKHSWKNVRIKQSKAQLLLLVDACMSKDGYCIHDRPCFSEADVKSLLIFLIIIHCKIQFMNLTQNCSLN